VLGQGREEVTEVVKVREGAEWGPVAGVSVRRWASAASAVW